MDGANPRLVGAWCATSGTGRGDQCVLAGRVEDSGARAIEEEERLIET